MPLAALNPLDITLLLLLAGVFLLAAELFLPTHGLVGAMGALCLLAAVGYCFQYNQWLAVGLLLAIVIATPFAWSLAIRIWPKTPMGRRMILPTVQSTDEPLPFQIGQQGVTLSALRPMGECELDGKRLSACAEDGMIPAGTPVIVVSADGRMPLVRACPQNTHVSNV